MASHGTDRLDRPTGTAAEYTGSGMQAAKEKAEHLSGRANEKTADLKRQVEQMVDDVRDRAHSAATDEKKQQYGRMKGITHAVRSACRMI